MNVTVIRIIAPNWDSKEPMQVVVKRGLTARPYHVTNASYRRVIRVLKTTAHTGQKFWTDGSSETRFHWTEEGRR
jgi:hypothetical protein